MSLRSLLFVPAVWLAFVTVGCGSAKEALVPVEGKVFVDGQPLDGVVVTFIPDIKKNCRGGAGTTGPTGVFEVTDLDQNRPGLPAGKYTVAYSRRRLPDGSAAPEPAEGKPVDPGVIQVETFPPHLLTPDPKVAGNQVEIPASGNTKLELKISTALNPALMGPG